MVTGVGGRDQDKGPRVCKSVVAQSSDIATCRGQRLEPKLGVPVNILPGSALF